jgi:hypothetical protein
MLKKIIPSENPDAWKGEREIGRVPLQVNKDQEGFFFTFEAQTNDEAWILNQAIDRVFKDNRERHLLEPVYAGNYDNKNFAGRHQWRLRGVKEEDIKEIIIEIKKWALKIKASEMVEA